MQHQNKIQNSQTIQLQNKMFYYKIQYLKHFILQLDTFKLESIRRMAPNFMF